MLSSYNSTFAESDLDEISAALCVDVKALPGLLGAPRTSEAERGFADDQSHQSHRERHVAKG